MHGLFKMPWESRHLPLGSNHRVRTRVTFILARTGTRRDHGDHLIRLSAQWSHKNVPRDSYSHPRLLRWGNGHQQQHLSLYVHSLTVCILIAQGNKGWRQISEEQYYNHNYHTRAVLLTWVCVSWFGGIDPMLMRYWPRCFPAIYFFKGNIQLKSHVAWISRSLYYSTDKAKIRLQNLHMCYGTYCWSFL